MYFLQTYVYVFLKGQKMQSVCIYWLHLLSIFVEYDNCPFWVYLHGTVQCCSKTLKIHCVPASLGSRCSAQVICFASGTHTISLRGSSGISMWPGTMLFRCTVRLWILWDRGCHFVCVDYAKQIVYLCFAQKHYWWVWMKKTLELWEITVNLLPIHIFF